MSLGKYLALVISVVYRTKIKEKTTEINLDNVR